MGAKGIAVYFTPSLKKIRTIHKILSAVLGFLQPDSQTDIHGEVIFLIFTTSDCKHTKTWPRYPLGRWLRANQSISGHGN